MDDRVQSNTQGREPFAERPRRADTKIILHALDATADRVLLKTTIKTVKELRWSLFKKR